MTTAHAIYAASVRQFAGLELEREGHLEQIAGLLDERNALRQENAQLRATLEKIANADAGGGAESPKYYQAFQFHNMRAWARAALDAEADAL